MSVSAPRGVMSPAVPAKSVQQLAAKSAPAGGFAKALTHHGHVGSALKAGDHKKAMHHVGHMMLAIRNASRPAQASAVAAAEPMPDDGTSDPMDSASPSQMPPAQKKPFNRGAFGAMKAKGK